MQKTILGLAFFIFICEPLRGGLSEEIELAHQYDHACQVTSDINEHLPTLRSLASECSSAVEIGLRTMVSSWGILQGLADSSAASHSYLGIDIEWPTTETLILAERLAIGNGISFQFIQDNDMSLDIPDTEFLFIDSLHTYCHLTYELETFSPKVSKYIAMHDTTFSNESIDDLGYQGDYSEYPSEYDRSKRGLWPAVTDFLERHPEWILFQRYFNNYGLTILKRQNT